MSLEIIGILIVGGGVIITGVGVLRLWHKNGTEAAKRDGALYQEIKGINKSQESIDKSIAHLSNGVNNQALHCASVTAGFTERIKDLEQNNRDGISKRINDLEQDKKDNISDRVRGLEDRENQ